MHSKTGLEANLHLKRKYCLRQKEVQVKKIKRILCEAGIWLSIAIPVLIIVID